MRRSELALAAHHALHSGDAELVLPETSWRIRIAPASGVRCVAVYSGSLRFYFQQHDPWAGDDEFSVLARLGHHITWVVQRDGDQITKSVVIDGEHIEDPKLVEELAA
jgi:hypothetical protein